MLDQTRQINTIGPQTELKRIFAVLIVIQGREIGRDYRLRKFESVIGRDRSCDICIPETTVSRQHAKIQLTYLGETGSYKCRLIDAGSTNKTYVNNKEAESVSLKNGDKIRIGKTILRFELLDAEDLKYHKEIQNKIKYDALTGLLTKESLYLALEHELQRCRQFNIPLSVLMMDLDHFKKTNDTHGHQAGSHTLKEIGSLITRTLRKTDVSSRYGGEEFVSYFSEQTKDKAFIVANKLRHAIESTAIMFGDATIHITISIGVAQFPEDGKTIDELVASADKALYEAKNTGRNKICLASTSE